ncbi:MAG: hypothetical protein IJ228_01705 [Succinivibrio sp.]|nr:hypothetical protein [Succinivibrio sp.]
MPVKEISPEIRLALSFAWWIGHVLIWIAVPCVADGIFTGTDGLQLIIGCWLFAAISWLNRLACSPYWGLDYPRDSMWLQVHPYLAILSLILLIALYIRMIQTRSFVLMLCVLVAAFMCQAQLYLKATFW